ncbi:helix-turn-helix domain-containing protein [Lactococcus cremoris]
MQQNPIADSWGVSRTTIYRYINKF